MTIILIMVGIGLSTYVSHRRTVQTDLAAEQIVDVMRDAYQRALGGRSTFIFEVQPSTEDAQGRVRILDGAENVVREEALPEAHDVAMPHVPDDEVPSSPFNFECIPASSDNGQSWRVYFRMNGQATDNGAGGTIVPQSGTMVFKVLQPDGSVRQEDEGLTRAITLFGPTGSIRYWRWDADNERFVPR